ncbi:MAG: hypothetical protein IKX54_00270 [Lachnospiraceae bacterium]|nr:hypothetical protein [Lachnospiraceae bacterium]
MKKSIGKKTISLLLVLVILGLSMVSVAAAETDAQNTNSFEIADLQQSEIAMQNSTSSSGAYQSGGMRAPIWMVALIAVLSIVVAVESVQLTRFRNAKQDNQ